MASIQSEAAEGQSLLNGSEETSCSARDVARSGGIFIGSVITGAAVIGGSAAFFATLGNALKLFPKNDVSVAEHAFWGAVAGGALGFLTAVALVLSACSKRCCHDNSNRGYQP